MLFRCPSIAKPPALPSSSARGGNPPCFDCHRCYAERRSLSRAGFGEQYGGNEGLAHQLRVYLATQERTLQQQGCTEVDVSDFLDYALKLDQEWPAGKHLLLPIGVFESSRAHTAVDVGGGNDCCIALVL